MKGADNLSLDARLGIVYPRGATVGGSTQVNAMNLGPPPDHEVSNAFFSMRGERWGSETNETF